MKKIINVGVLIGIFTCLFLLVGCDENLERDATIHNEYNFKHPEYVGKMPDGRELKRIKVANAHLYDHYIYFFSTNDMTTLSVNTSVHSGKTTRLETIIIDGQNYNLTLTNK
jgi:hypothetical protein